MPKEEKEEVVEEAVVHEEDWGKEALTSNHICIYIYICVCVYIYIHVYIFTASSIFREMATGVRWRLPRFPINYFAKRL